MSIEREDIFIEYNIKITIYYKIYISDLYQTIISSNIYFFENIPESSINNYQLWIEFTDRIFKESKDIFNKLIIRNKRKRSIRQRKKHNKYISQVPTVDFICYKYISYKNNALTEINKETVLFIMPE